MLAALHCKCVFARQPRMTLVFARVLQVLGNCKGVIAAAVSVALFKNVVTLKGLVGYAITIAGVFAYSETKRRLKPQLKAVESQKSFTNGDVEAASPLIPASKASGVVSPQPQLSQNSHRTRASTGT